MTNHEYLQQMPTDEFADWLCRQLWYDYDTRKTPNIDLQRLHCVRNFLLMEYEEEESECEDNSRME